jgi:hypothetical protein
MLLRMSELLGEFELFQVVSLLGEMPINLAYVSSQLEVAGVLVTGDGAGSSSMYE